ncbi:MAG: VapC toxin family PIN domain ribonuclease [Devosia sp.]|nr:VapC toxin family PIN domain ribonuclease [Devosia sp.]
MFDLLAEGQVLMHPFVVGEVGLGSMQNWDGVMFRLLRLPTARRATDQAIITMIGQRRLQGSGIGYVDAHLLGSCLLAADTFLWTRDRRLANVAARLGVDATST